MKTSFKKSFKGELLSGHKECAVEVPFDPEAAWGIAAQPLWRGRRGHEVTARLKGHKFESFIVKRQQKFFMLVDNETMKTANLSVGDLVNATVSPRE